MQSYMKNIIYLVLVLCLLPTLVLGANNLTDIGCYEYGYDSAVTPNNPKDNYTPGTYGENYNTNYYISLTGSDSTGDGSQSNPWGTLGYAVTRATSGSTINLASGTYIINSQVFIPVGVNLEGSGNNTIITSTSLTSEFNSAIINLVSNGNVNGNQHISNLSFDGNNMTISQGLEIRNRNNVSVHDCTFKNFKWIAVGWRSGLWSELSDILMGTNSRISIPQTYVTGGRFYNNTVTNCAGYDSYARGALFCGGLEGFRIYNNVMTEDNSLGGNTYRVRGVPIKFWYYHGWMLNCKIYDNQIHKLNNAASGNDAAGWPFAIESIYHYGMEICNNDFIGAIDLNYGFTGKYDGFKGHKASNDTHNATYDYATWIHDNNIHANGDNGWEHRSIILEFDAEKSIIERNKITDCSSLLYFTPRSGCTISDITFRHNLCTDIRMYGSSDADAIRIDGWNTGFTLTNFAIENNVISCANSNIAGSQTGGYGIILSHPQNSIYTGTNISIANNIISGFRWNPLVIQNQTSINGLNIENNLFFNNNGWNGTNGSSTMGNITNTGVISNYVNSNNAELNSAQYTGLFVNIANKNYHLANNSFAIDSGKNLNNNAKDLDGNSVPYTEDEVTVPIVIEVDNPTISPNGGTFTDTQTVTLSCTTDGANIYYTTTGNTPTANSTLYTSPFTVSATTTVRAIAIKDNVICDNVISATFTKKVIIPDNENEQDDDPIEIIPEWKNPFTDISNRDWFYSNVEKAYKQNIMKGITDTKFGPYTNTTRGMLVTILYRIENEPRVASQNPFSDVGNNMYYTKPIIWAEKNEIVTGYDDGTYKPENPITREQMATILYRYAKYKGYDVSIGEETNIQSYNDISNLSEWAIPAMQWACGSELIQGSNGNLSPTNYAERCQAVTILVRFMENIK